MNKKVLSLLLSVATIFTAQARHLTPDEALSRVADPILNAQTSTMKLAPADLSDTELVYSADIDSRPMAYVFSNSGGRGFMVVSADDVAVPLLGYSDNTAFDPENIPVNMKAWLDGYARQIEYAANNSVLSATPVAASERAERQPVAPKLTTTWNQDAPYWNDCPTLNGNRCYTGCVATAMAQVMNYHQWPEQGQGSITYSWTYGGNRSLTCNFAEMTFEWDKMLDSYTTNSPAENCAAVAQLMKACGYASKMQYTPYASGTTGYSAAQALVTYFNYDKSLIIQNREWYNAQDWEDLVYTELTTNGPVYYDGSGSDGGHAFVCDGYRSNGYFHFNWGWGGLSDGYFLLGALNPGSQGAGGNTSGFNMGQSIMQNLSKPKSGSSVSCIIGASCGFTTSTTSTTLGRSVSFTPVISGQGCGFYSYSIASVSNLAIGVKYRNTATGAVNYMTSSYYSNISLEPLHGFVAFSATLPYILAAGEYILTPVYRVGSGEWQDMKTEPSYSNALIMTVTGSTATFADAGAEATIRATDIVVPESINVSENFVISLSLTNTGTRDFSGQIQARFLNGNGTVLASGYTGQTEVPAGATLRFQYTSGISSGSLPDGVCYMAFYSPNLREYLNDPIKVTVSTPLSLSCSQLRVSSASSVDCNNVTVKATVTCDGRMYTGPLAFIASSSSEELVPVGMFLSEEMTLKAGSSESVSFSGVFEEGEVGRYYYAALAYKVGDKYEQIGTSMVRFRVSKASGIDDIAADGGLSSPVIYPNPAESVAVMESPVDIKSVEVYSLSGAAMPVSADIDGPRAELDVAALPAGTYIVVAAGTDASRHTVKLIKR